MRPDALTSWVSIFARAMEIDEMCLLCVPLLAFSFFISVLNSDSQKRLFKGINSQTSETALEYIK